MCLTTIILIIAMLYRKVSLFFSQLSVKYTSHTQNHQDPFFNRPEETVLITSSQPELTADVAWVRDLMIRWLLAVGNAKVESANSQLCAGYEVR